MKHLLALALVVGLTIVASAQQVYRMGDRGVTGPTAIKIVKPQYTQQALQQRIQGSVLLECVVAADGSVGEIRVLESLDTTYGLDDQAIAALRQSEFRPGRVDDKPVAVRVNVEMNFSLK